MPYLTPDSIPEDDNCRPLLIPASSDWLAIVSGALTELIKTYNWEQVGAVTVAEAVARMQAMIDSYYDGCEPCEACTLPGGYPVLRLNPDTGNVEELNSDGEWVEPFGDYSLPDIPAREVGDPICLAATNGANVLKQLYESLSDSFNSELSAAAAYIAMADFLVTVTAVAVGLITLGIGLFVIAAFGAIYAAVEFIAADVWDETFTEALICVLIDCATNTDGVVTFDYNCVNKALYNRINLFDLSETQLRLWGQVAFIIQSIGGSDGLNQAGAATAITEADCSFCATEWCYEWTTSQLNGTDWSGITQGSLSNFGATGFSLPDGAITHIEFTFVWTGDGGGGDSAAAIWVPADTRVLLELPISDLGSPATLIWEGSEVSPSDLQIGANGAAGSTTTITITHVEVHGSGTLPGWVDGAPC